MLETQLVPNKSILEDYDDVVCRIHLRQPDLIQIVLTSILSARVLRCAHYFFAGHLRQTRFYRRVSKVFCWPNKQQVSLTPFSNAFLLLIIGYAFPSRCTPSFYSRQGTARVGKYLHHRASPEDQTSFSVHPCHLRSFHHTHSGRSASPHHGIRHCRRIHLALCVQVRSPVDATFIYCAPVLRAPLPTRFSNTPDA